MNAKETDIEKTVRQKTDSSTLESEPSTPPDMNATIAGATHDINNFLTGILGQTQLLQREELGSTARRRVETIEQLAKRIRDSVEKLGSV